GGGRAGGPPPPQRRDRGRRGPVGRSRPRLASLADLTTTGVFRVAVACSLEGRALLRRARTPRSVEPEPHLHGDLVVGDRPLPGMAPHADHAGPVEVAQRGARPLDTVADRLVHAGGRGPGDLADLVRAVLGHVTSSSTWRASLAPAADVDNRERGGGGPPAPWRQRRRSARRACSSSASRTRVRRLLRTVLPSRSAARRPAQEFSPATGSPSRRRSYARAGGVSPRI